MNKSHLPAALEDSFPLEKARLRLVPLFAVLQCMSILLFGWTIQYPRQVPYCRAHYFHFHHRVDGGVHQSIVMTYLVDVFHSHSAAASASLNLARCLFAAGGTSFVIPMVDVIGVGLTFTAYVGMQCVALVGLAVQMRFGARWRKASEEELKAAENRVKSEQNQE